MAELLAVALAVLVLASRPRPRLPRLARSAPVAIATRTLVLVVALIGLGGLVVSLAAASFAGLRPSADAARLAVIRSAVLAIAAVSVAGWRAAGGPLELPGLAWTIVASPGSSCCWRISRRPRGTLVLSLTLYGSALILVPALLRRARPRGGSR